MHFHADQAVAFAGLATAATHVETEAARVVTARAGLGHFGEQFAHGTENARVGRRVRPRRTADGALVDVDHAIDLREPFNRTAGRGFPARIRQRVRGVAIQRVDDERRLA